MKPTEEEIREENRKIRWLRMLIDLTISTLYQGKLPLSEALKLIENTRVAALKLFPNKEKAYDLIYKPRFERVFYEVYGSRTIH